MTSGAWRSVFFSAACQDLRIDADFALRDDAALVRVHVLDRILDRNDVATRVLITVADHGRQRGRLTRTGTADDDAQTALVHDDVFQDRWQLEIFERRDLGRDRSQNSADHALLDECADAEAADALRRDREVAFLGRVEFLDLLVVHDRAHHDRRLIRGQRRVGCLVNRAIDLDRRRKAAVMNRSEPSRSTILRNRFCVSRTACSRSIVSLQSGCRLPALEIFLVDGAEARLFLVDQALRHQLGKVLIERLHAGTLPGLDRRVHLRDLAFANQVSDRRRADHDLVCRNSAATDSSSAASAR